MKEWCTDMSVTNQQEVLNDEKIRNVLNNFCSNSHQVGLEAYVVVNEIPRLRRMSLNEETNGQGKNFRMVLKEMLLKVLSDEYLSESAEYADGSELADNQHKYLFFKQEAKFYPFDYLNGDEKEFSLNDLNIASGIVFRLRKDMDSIWLYQHLWSMMVPNKKRTQVLTRLIAKEAEVVFSEQQEQLLIIAKRIDILIIGCNLITDNVKLLEKSFGFINYIEQTANKTIQNIIAKNIVENEDKLKAYITNRKTKYAKKMMRISSSKVLDLEPFKLIEQIQSVARWKDKFIINSDTKRIVLRTFQHVESLIDLFDERYTRSEITTTEYDTEVKRVATL